MAFDWMHYLHLAEFLFLQKEDLEIDEEAICRCAVSRAYYAAYCYSRNVAQDYMNYQPPSKRETNAHEHLINFFKEQMGLTGTGSDLSRLRGWRTACDYDNEIPRDRLGSILLLPEGAFKYAHRILNELNQRYGNPLVTDSP